MWDRVGGETDRTRFSFSDINSFRTKLKDFIRFLKNFTRLLPFVYLSFPTSVRSTETDVQKYGKIVNKQCGRPITLVLHVRKIYGLTSDTGVGPVVSLGDGSWFVYIWESLVYTETRSFWKLLWHVSINYGRADLQSVVTFSNWGQDEGVYYRYNFIKQGGKTIWGTKSS